MKSKSDLLPNNLQPHSIESSTIITFFSFDVTFRSLLKTKRLLESK